MEAKLKSFLIFESKVLTPLVLGILLGSSGLVGFDSVFHLVMIPVYVLCILIAIFASGAYFRSVKLPKE